MLYVQLACPWANRTLCFLQLKGLTKAIEVAVAAPIWQQTKPGVDEHRGWVFDPSVEGCTVDPVLGAKTVREVYEGCSNFNESVDYPHAQRGVQCLC
jgi:glutathionyl-hydroquinone reductase